MLYKVVLTFSSVDETIQMKAVKKYFHVVLFIMLYKVVSKSVYETLGEERKEEHVDRSAWVTSIRA